MTIRPIAVLILAAGLWGCGKSPQAQAPAAGKSRAAVPVEMTTVGTATLLREVVAVGSMRSDESVTLSPEVAGRIARIGFEEGRPVQAGQLLFELDAAVPRATVAEARASRNLAARNHERGTELFERRLISQQERDTLRSALESAEATLALAQAQLAKTRITAPFAGTAGLRQVSPGDYVNPGQALVSLEAMARLKVDFRLPETVLSRLAPGQPLDIELDAWPGERFRAEVYAIEPRVAESTRSIGLRARLPNPDGRLRPGLYARVRLQTAREADAVVVPEQAIFPRGEQQFVYVVAGGVAQEREVRIGQREPGRAEILDGLRPGEVIVTAGLQKLSPGAAVVPAPSRDAAGR